MLACCIVAGIGLSCGSSPQVVESARNPLRIAALGTAWHPDPDDDGVASSEDLCPTIHDPAQQDVDSDGIGDACDPDLAPAEGSTQPVLRIQHITPYGAWLSLLAPPSPARQRAGIVWSSSREALASLVEAKAATSPPDSGTLPLFLGAMESQRDALVITAMNPATTYYVAAYRRDPASNVLSMSEPMALTTAPEPTIALTGPHPRLLLTAEDIDRLRGRRASGDSVWRALERRMGDLVQRAATPGRRVYQRHGYCTTAALLYSITGDIRYRAAAAQLLALTIEHFEKERIRGQEYQRDGSSLAICLDLLWNELDSPTRARAMSAYLARDAENIDSSTLPSDPAAPGALAITATVLMNSLLACGAEDAPEPQREQACARLELARRRWFGIELVELRRARGIHALAGGFGPEGTEFYRRATGHWISAFLTLQNAGVPMTQYRDVLRNILFTVWLYPLTPRLGGHMALGNVTGFARPEREPHTLPVEALEPELVMLAGALERTRLLDEAAWARWLIGRYQLTDEPARAVNLMYENGSIRPRDPRLELPLAHLDQAAGLLFDRTSWSEDASLLLLRAGWSGSDRAHGDSGQIQLYRRGMWITRESLGRDGIATDAQAHNVLALEGATRNGPRAGQYTLDSTPIRGIVRASSGAHYGFAVADTTGAYNSERNQSLLYRAVQRSILWLKSDERGSADILIIHDAVARQAAQAPAQAAQAPAQAAQAPAQAAQAPIPPRLYFHFDAAPAITGQRAIIELPGLRPGTRPQHVELDVLSPERVTLSALAPGGNADSYPSAIYTHRVQVQPELATRTADNPADLHVLTVLRASDANSPAAPAPRGVHTEAFMGALIGSHLVLFPRAFPDDSQRSSFPGAQISVELTHIQPGPITVWLAGFAPGSRVAVSARRSAGTLELTANPSPTSGTANPSPTSNTANPSSTNGIAHITDSAGLLVISIDPAGAITPLPAQR